MKPHWRRNEVERCERIRPVRCLLDKHRIRSFSGTSTHKFRTKELEYYYAACSPPCSFIYSWLSSVIAKERFKAVELGGWHEKLPLQERISNYIRQSDWFIYLARYTYLPYSCCPVFCHLTTRIINSKELSFVKRNYLISTAIFRIKPRRASKQVRPARPEQAREVDMQYIVWSASP